MSTSRHDHGKYLFDGATSDRPRPEQAEHAGPPEGKASEHKHVKIPPPPGGNDRAVVGHDGALDTSDVSPLKARERTSHRGSGSSQYAPAAYAPRKVPAGTSVFGGDKEHKAGKGKVHSGRTPAAPIEREIKAAEKRGKPSATQGHKRERPVKRSAVTGRSGHRLPSELPSESETLGYR